MTKIAAAFFEAMFKPDVVEGNTCPVCKQTVMEGFEYFVVVHQGCSTFQDTCCSVACVADYKLNMLREQGL